MEKALVFRTLQEEVPGPKWRSLFDYHWPAYEAWYLAEGSVSGRVT